MSEPCCEGEGCDCGRRIVAELVNQLLSDGEGEFKVRVVNVPDYGPHLVIEQDRG